MYRYLGSKVARAGAIWPLALVGVLLELVYAGYMLRLFYLPAYYDVPLQDLGKLTAYGKSAGITFVAAATVAFALYGTALRLICGVDKSRCIRGASRLIVGFAALFGCTLALVYPYGAADIFDYSMFGRIMSLYGANPFVISPATFASDPFVPYVAWRQTPFVYGPLWALPSAVLSRLGADNLLTTLILYKAFVIVLYLGSLWLIRSILHQIAPQREAGGMLLFAWNPLVVTEIAANGHNDVMMMFFVLLAVRLAIVQCERKRALALPALAAAVLSKFAMAMLVPLFAASLWRQQRSGPRRALPLAIGVLLAGGLAVASFAPFWLGWDTLREVWKHGEEWYTTSFATIVKLNMEGRFADTKLVGKIVLAAFALYCLFESWRLRPGIANLTAAAYRIVLVYLLFACLWFQPWYLIWLVALAAIAPTPHTTRLTALFSFTATMNYFVFGYLWLWNAPRWKLVDVQPIAVAVIFALPLAYALFLAATSIVRLMRRASANQPALSGSPPPAANPGNER